MQTKTRSFVVILATSLIGALVACGNPSSDQADESSDAIISPASGDAIQAKVSEMYRGTRPADASEEVANAARAELDRVTAADIAKLLPENETPKIIEAVGSLVDETTHASIGAGTFRSWSWVEPGPGKHQRLVNLTANYVHARGQTLVYAERDTFTRPQNQLKRELFVFSEHNLGLGKPGASPVSRQIVALSNEEISAAQAAAFKAQLDTIHTNATPGQYLGDREKCNSCMDVIRWWHHWAQKLQVLGGGLGLAAGAGGATMVCTGIAEKWALIVGGFTAMTGVGAPAAPETAAAGGAVGFAGCMATFTAVAVVLYIFTSIDNWAQLPADAAGQMAWCNDWLDTGSGKPTCVYMPPKHCRDEELGKAKSPLELCETEIYCAIDTFDGRHDRDWVTESEIPTWCRETLGVVEDSPGQPTLDKLGLCERAMKHARVKRPKTTDGVQYSCCVGMGFKMGEDNSQNQTLAPECKAIQASP